MTCEICQRRRPSLFITVEQMLFNRITLSKAHACLICFGILKRDEGPELVVTKVDQQEFNEAVV